MRVGRCDEARILGSVGRRRKAGGLETGYSGPTGGTGEWGEEGEAEGDPPSPPAPSRVWRESDRALTDGHVVAAVREAGVPVTELGLVAGAGALGLTGHWVGHGCRGRGRGSAGSLAAPPRPWHLCRPSLCRAVRARPPGRPSRGHHCVFPVPAATSGHRHPHSVPGVAASCMSGSARGEGGILQVYGRLAPHVGGAETCHRLLQVWAWGAGFPRFRASGVQAGAVCLRSQSAQGKEVAVVQGLEGLRVHPAIPPLPFTLSCISNCILLALRRWRWGRQRWRR